MSIENKLKELNIILPEAPAPVGSYVAFKIVDKLLFISGQISLDTNGKLIKEKLDLKLMLILVLKQLELVVLISWLNLKMLVEEI